MGRVYDAKEYRPDFNRLKRFAESASKDLSKALRKKDCKKALVQFKETDRLAGKAAQLALNITGKTGLRLAPPMRALQRSAKKRFEKSCLRKR